MRVERWESASLQINKTNAYRGNAWAFDVTVERSTARMIWTTPEGAQADLNMIIQTGPFPAWAKQEAGAAGVLSQVRVRILAVSGKAKGAGLKWKAEFGKDVRDAEEVLAQMTHGKLAVLSQGPAVQAPVRLVRGKLTEPEGGAEILKDVSGEGFKVGQVAVLSYRNAQTEEEAEAASRNSRKKGGRADGLGTWGLAAGFSSLGYAETFRPKLSASYVTLSGWGDWSLGGNGRFSVRSELSTVVLPLVSELSQAVAGEQATLARFIRLNFGLGVHALKPGADFRIQLRPGFAYATMLVSNPQFGYFNMTGPSLGISFQRVPRAGRKFYVEGSAEFVNTAPFDFDSADMGFNAAAGASITQFWFGELDGYIKYRAVGLGIGVVKVSESAFEIGMGFRW